MVVVGSHYETFTQGAYSVFTSRVSQANSPKEAAYDQTYGTATLGILIFRILISELPHKRNETQHFDFEQLARIRVLRAIPNTVPDHS